MSIFWLIVFVTALAAAFMIARPLLLSEAASAPTDESEEARLDAALAAIRRDLDCGLMDASAASHAENEARRAFAAETSADAPRVSRAGRMAAFGALGAAPLAAVLLYLNLGAPQALTAPRGAAQSGGAEEAIAALPEEERRRMIEGMVAGLAERLKSEPDNPEGWRMLARSYHVLGRPQDSVAAWREFLKRGDAGAEDWRQYAYSMMDLRPQGDDTVSAELEEALLKLQSFNPDDPLALYNLGHAARDRGDKAKALALWTRLQETLPPDTPLAPTLSRLISEAK